ncbi:hypothetical protein [Smaragdicoccus niigatensis]|uniref:hypothetical protein n=1 Tax=Smaragdicoccus niigatensis TaxID=359359 RepID=UPI00037BE1B1|nr:hypothetical protein [Smaragdicoccus niigatensis]
MRRTRLDRLDEACLNVGSVDEPWTVHLEIRVEGRLDDELVRRAVVAAMATHPLARAHIVAWRPTDFRYWWEISDQPGDVPLTVVDCAESGNVATARNKLLSRAPELQRRIFEVLLAHAPGGDYLILNLHHAGGDGISAHRLMTSILRHYANEPDPVPSFDPLEARNVRDIIGAHGAKDRWTRSKRFGRYLRQNLRKPARVQTSGGTRISGYGCHPMRLDAEQTAAILARRPEGTTVNDLLVGALAVTIRRWNDAHGTKKPRRVSITVPVNVRPAEWQHEVLGNFASYVTVNVPRKSQRDSHTATGAVHECTSEMKGIGAQGIMVDLLKVSQIMPAGVKKLIQRRPLVGDRAVDTTWLTNLGRLDLPVHLGETAGAVTELGFSAPATMPMGVTLGVATMGDEMFLTFRYRHPQFDAAAAADFAALFQRALESG